MKTKKISINQVANLVVVIVAGLIALKIYQGQSKKITQINYAINEQQKKNEALLRIGDLKKKTESYKTAFHSEDSREIIKVITDLAKGSGAQIILLKPHTSRTVVRRRGEEQLYDKSFFNITIELDGYHRLGEFISKLESDSMEFIVESLSISMRQNILTIAERLEVNLVIGKFFFKN